MKILERWLRLQCTIAGFVLFAVAVAITADVLKRWLAGQPFVGIFEFTEIAFLIFTFLTVGLVEYMDRQMKIDMLSSHIRGRAGAFLAMGTTLLGIAFWGVFLWVASKQWLAAYEIHETRPGLIHVPSVIHIGFLVFGTLFVCLSLLTTFVSSFRRLLHPPALLEATGPQEERISWI